MKLLIANKNYSSWSLRPWILLKEKQIDFEEVMVKFGTGDDVSEEFKATITKYGGSFVPHKVPLLVVNKEVVVYDSLAIVEYLHEAYGKKHNIYPKTLPERVLARSIACEVHSSFSALRSNFGFNVEAKFPHVGAKVLKENAAVKKDVQRIYDIINQCVKKSKGPFLFGKEFCAADAFLTPIVQRFYVYNVLNLMETNAAVKQYCEAIRNTKSFQEWCEAALKEQEFVPFDEPYRKSRL